MSSLAERRAAALARREAAQPAPVPAPEPSAPTKPCASCGAPVVWIETAARQRMPLDPPLRRGVASAQAPEGLPRLSVVDSAGRVVQIVEHPEGTIEGRVSHFATCPAAAEHRKPRQPRGERRPARPAERRVAAVPALPPDPPPAPTATTEPAGARVAVVHAPIGPRCTVATDDGRLIRGHRVPLDYRGSDLEVVSIGRCVTAWTTDSAGRIVVDEHGRTQLTPDAGGGVTMHRIGDATDVDHVVDAVPPPLPTRAS